MPKFSHQVCVLFGVKSVNVENEWSCVLITHLITDKKIPADFKRVF